jgi:hypothetical protein
MVLPGCHRPLSGAVGDTVEPRRQSALDQRVERFGCFAGALIAPPSIGNDADTDMPNPLHPDHLTPTERLDEVARLLALGYLRLRARRQAEKANEPNHLSEFGLDFRGEGSVCDTDANDQRRR